MQEIPLEASPEDVAEQRADVTGSDPDGDTGVPSSTGGRSSTSWEADPADVAEQQAEVPLDDDWV